MGFIDNLGRVASTYMDEKQKLQEGTEKRMRPRAGHAFWPHEVLRDAILFASILSTLLFYAWFIPPPLHSAADPFAQAGFVFPDWYVLFSYGYLRIGEYLPQFDVPLGPIGDIFGTPVFSWNAAWWGAALTGIPIGILAIPPFIGGREKRGVEDPGYAAPGRSTLATSGSSPCSRSTSSWNCSPRIEAITASSTVTAISSADRGMVHGSPSRTSSMPSHGS